MFYTWLDAELLGIKIEKNSKGQLKNNIINFYFMLALNREALWQQKKYYFTRTL